MVQQHDIRAAGSPQSCGFRPSLAGDYIKIFPRKVGTYSLQKLRFILNYQYPVPWHPLALLKSRDLPPRKGEIFFKHTLKMGAFVKMQRACSDFRTNGYSDNCIDISKAV
jgi:hypothetical protein